MSKLWSLIPLQVRLGFYAAIALGVISLFLWLSYTIHNDDKLKSDNAALLKQHQTDVEYVERMDQWTKVKEKGKSDGAAKIRNYGPAIAPPVIVDTIAGLPEYGDLLPP